jgi:hypothetical protein
VAEDSSAEPVLAAECCAAGLWVVTIAGDAGRTWVIACAQRGSQQPVVEAQLAARPAFHHTSPASSKRGALPPRDRGTAQDEREAMEPLKTGWRPL